MPFYGPSGITINGESTGNLNITGNGAVYNSGTLSVNGFNISNGTLTINNPTSLQVSGANQTLTQTSVVPYLRANQIASGNSAGNFTISLPNEPIAGNLLIAAWCDGGSVLSGGFTELISGSSPTSSAIYGKISSGQDQSVEFGAPGYPAGIYFEFEAWVGNIGDIVSSSGVCTISGNGISSSSISVPAGNALIVFFIVSPGNNSSSSYSPTGAAKIVEENSNNNSSILSSIYFPGSSSTQNVTISETLATTPTSADWLAILIPPNPANTAANLAIT